nr:putative calcium-transporting ATPase 13, plasma membrane-type [Ipomoea batatas]
MSAENNRGFTEMGFGGVLPERLRLASEKVKESREQGRGWKIMERLGNINVEVVRDGRKQAISIFDIVVGYVVCL